MKAIRLRTLGRIELTAADGRELHTVLAQPKRLLLLVHLAIAGPTCPRRRDALVALFWPEAGEQRARAALSQSLTFLRRAIGDDPFVTRGAQDIAIRPERLWCDVVEFERLLDAGADEDALALYGGAFLDALHVSDLPDAERWLDGERQRLRTVAAEAAGRLADTTGGRGDHAAALGHAARAFALASEDERALRRLMTAYDRVGDRAGALRTYAAAAQRLRSEWGVEPAAETAALVHRLRDAERHGTDADLHRPGLTATATAEPTVPTAPLPPPPRRSVAPARRRVRRPRATTGAVAFLLVVLVVLVVALGRLGAFGTAARATPPDPAGAPTVAVLPFAVHGPDGAPSGGTGDYLGEGLVELLSRNLDGAGALRAADAGAVLGLLRRIGADEGERPVADPALVRRVAEHVGASHVVLGSVTTAGGDLRLGATLYGRAEHGDTLLTVAHAEARGDTARLFHLVDQLTLQLLAAFPQHDASRLARTAALTTASVPALKAWLDGEALYRAQRWTEALDAFQEAVRLDSSFALAHYRVSAAADWAARSELVKPAAERAFHAMGRLGTHDSLLVHAHRAFRREESGEAERVYREIVATWPDDVEAWYQLGEVLFHLNPKRGRSVLEAREPFAQVLRLDPDNEEVLLHLLRLAARAGRTADVDSLSRRLLAQLPAHRRVEIEAFRAFTIGSPGETAHALEALRRGTVADRYVTAWRVAVFARRLEPAAQVARLLTEPVQGRDMRATGHQMLAGIHAAQGRPRAAEAELAAMAELRGNAALVLRALHGVIPVVGAPPPTLRRLLAELRVVEAPPGQVELPPVRDDVDPLVITHAAGIVSAALGDSARASAAARRLTSWAARADSSDTRAALARTLAASLAAHVAWRTDRAPDGLQALRPLAAGHWTTWSVLEPLDRFVLAELLRAVGRSDEALGWYASLADVSYEGVPFLGIAELRQAELHEGRGDTVRAAAHYRRFVELWRGCEPEVRSTATAAARRLANLGS